MHNRALHDSLAAFVEEAAWQLAEEVSGGAEIPFELDATPTRSAPLYCYRPLTGRFIAQRIGHARPPAVVSGRRAGPRARCPTCRPTCSRRGRRVPAGDARARRLRAAGVPRRGLGRRHRLRLRRRALPRRLRRARGDRLRRLRALGRAHAGRGPRDRVRRGAARRRARARARRRRSPTRPHGLRRRPARDRRGARAGEPTGDGRALETAGRRLRRLQTALRLWDDAEPALGPTAWARTDGSAWMAVPLATGMRRPAGDCLLTAEEEDPLRAFCGLVARRTPRAGELAWALRRFELGCERGGAVEALTDWLLAARALFADVDRVGYDGVAERLAAICAEAHDRAAPRGPRARGDLARARRDGRLRAARRARSTRSSCELGGCLRAVLRDVLCGHLDPGAAAASRDELRVRPTASSRRTGVSGRGRGRRGRGRRRRARGRRASAGRRARRAAASRSRRRGRPARPARPSRRSRARRAPGRGRRRRPPAASSSGGWWTRLTTSPPNGIPASRSLRWKKIASSTGSWRGAVTIRNVVAGSSSSAPTRRGALGEAVDHPAERAEERRQVAQQVDAGDPLQDAEDDARCRGRGSGRDAGGAQEHPDRAALEEAGQAAGGVEEVERVARGRRVEDEHVEVAGLGRARRAWRSP